MGQTLLTCPGHTNPAKSCRILPGEEIRSDQTTENEVRFEKVTVRSDPNMLPIQTFCCLWHKSKFKFVKTQLPSFWPFILETESVIVFGQEEYVWPSYVFNIFCCTSGTAHQHAVASILQNRLGETTLVRVLMYFPAQNSMRRRWWKLRTSCCSSALGSSSVPIRSPSLRALAPTFTMISAWNEVSPSSFFRVSTCFLKHSEVLSIKPKQPTDLQNKFSP